MPDTQALLTDVDLRCYADDIVQTYLWIKPDSELRVRARCHNDKWSFFRTHKQGSGIKRPEDDRGISEDDYHSAINAAQDPKSLTKKRYVFWYENQCFEVDVYPWIDDMAVMEVELKSEDQAIEFPNFIDIIKEVTGDKHYSNATIAQAGEAWRPTS
jgi:CYTH domain-containing protein